MKSSSSSRMVCIKVRRTQTGMATQMVTVATIATRRSNSNVGTSTTKTERSRTCVKRLVSQKRERRS